MAAVLTGSSKADNENRVVSGEDIATAFSKFITNCDPYRDMILAEVVGEVVGYARGWWVAESETTYLYKHTGFLLPEWRRKGIGCVMLNWMEKNLKEIAKAHPRESEKYFQVNLGQSQKGAAILLERAGYQPVRHFYQMVRSTLDDLPDFQLPEGLEILPVTPDHYRPIWESMYAASEEEWGTSEPSEEAYKEWQKHLHFQPELWQIAWDLVTNKVIGTVLTYISHDENQQFERQRGYTEGVGVVPTWRRRGVARALISLSLQAQRAAGMTESALVADSQSAFGITRLYESCGFQIVDRDTVYRKPL
jgi:GNAT superfamily N-acetyltransferase